MIYLALGFFVGLLSHRIWRRVALRKAWERLDRARNLYFTETARLADWSEKYPS